MTSASTFDEADTSIGSRLRRTNRNLRKRRAVEDSEDESEVIDDQEKNDEVESLKDGSDLASEDEYRPRVKKTGNSKKRRRTSNNIIHSGAHQNIERIVPSNIDEVEDFEENIIFEALSNSNAPVSEIATEWIEQFTDEGGDHENKKLDAVKDLVNLVLRSCGCVSLVKRHDVVDPDKADRTVAEVQELFLSQKSHEYPLGLGNNASRPEWKGYRARAAEFMEQLVYIASERGILYDNDDFIDTIVSWLGSMSTVNERSMRFTATFFSLQLETTLCKIYTQSSKFIARCQRQLTSEKKNLERLTSASRKARNADQKEKSIRNRIEMISENTLSYTKKRSIVEKLIKDVFTTFFVHRYKDTNPQLRKECIASLGVWVKELPELFFKPIYLRYFGWLLTDPKGTVRLQVLKSLIPLYQRPNSASALRQFTRHFKDTFIEMAIHERDTSVKVSAISLLAEMVKNSFLEDDEACKISSLIFTDDESESDENKERIIKELARFVCALEQEKYTEFMEIRGASIKSLKKSIHLSLNDMLKFKFLFKVLEDGHEYFLNLNGSHGNKYEKLRQIAEALFVIPRYNMKNEALEFLISYILFDSSSVTEWSGTLRASFELSSWDSTMILAFIYGVTTAFVEGSNSYTYRTVMSRSVRRNLGDPKDREYYLVKVISSLPKVISVVNTNVSLLSLVSLIICKLVKDGSAGTNTFRETNQEPSFVTVALLVLQYFANSDIPYVSLGSDVLVPGSYENSDNYAFGLFFENLTNDYTEINVKIDSMLVGLHETLISSVDNAKLSEATDTILKLVLISEGTLLFEKVCKILADDLGKLSKFVVSVIKDEHRSVESKKSFLICVSDLLCRFLTETAMRFVFESSGSDFSQSEHEKLELYAEEFAKADIILTALQDIVKDENVDFIFRIIALNRWAEVYSFFNTVEIHYVNSSSDDKAALLKSAFRDPTKELKLGGKISGSLEELLISLFVKAETEYGEASGILSDLTGESSDPDEFSAEDRDSAFAQLLMVARALEMLAACDVFNSDVRFRVEKNRNALGEPFRKSTENAYSQVEELGKELDGSFTEDNQNITK